LAWEEKLLTVNDRADEIISNATVVAKKRAEEIVSTADSQAEVIISQAKHEAKLEKEKAMSEFKNEVVEVSTALTEKMLGREVNKSDHDRLIDEFIAGLGEDK
jgi:F-type H+-transporting ATPase subunit b